MEPFPHAWIIVIGFLISLLAFVVVLSSFRAQARARTWSIVVENELREEVAERSFPDAKTFTVTVDPEGLVLRMEPEDGSGRSVNFYPDITKRGYIVDLVGDYQP